MPVTGPGSLEELKGNMSQAGDTQGLNAAPLDSSCEGTLLALILNIDI